MPAHFPWNHDAACCWNDPSCECLLQWVKSRLQPPPTASFARFLQTSGGCHVAAKARALPEHRICVGRHSGGDAMRKSARERVEVQLERESEGWTCKKEAPRRTAPAATELPYLACASELRAPPTRRCGHVSVHALSNLDQKRANIPVRPSRSSCSSSLLNEGRPPTGQSVALTRP